MTQPNPAGPEADESVPVVLPPDRSETTERLGPALAGADAVFDDASDGSDGDGVVAEPAFLLESSCFDAPPTSEPEGGEASPTHADFGAQILARLAHAADVRTRALTRGKPTPRPLADLDGVDPVEGSFRAWDEADG
jgi:hypothetical protein